MPINPLAEPSYRRELDDNLVLRWSTAADQEAIAQLYSYVFRDGPDLPYNHMMHAWLADLMGGQHPLCGPGEFAIVEDTRSGQVVTATGLMHFTIELDGISIPMGRPEIVASHPDYRNRGLVRAVFELIHARSDGRGHLAQGITGISYYYRLFGYEYALDLGGGKIMPFSAIPKLKTGESEPYSLVDATIDDLPQLARLYDRERAHAAVSTTIDSTYWRWLLDGQNPNAGEGWQIKMIVDREGRKVGYTLPRRLRWGDRFGINGIVVEADIALPTVLPSMLRALKTVAEGAEAFISAKDPPPASNLYLHLGRANPLFGLLSESQAPRTIPPYGWYIRVPDLAALVRHMAPLLETRLANSALAHYSGELRLDFYRNGLRIAFEGGKLRTVEPWRAEVWGAEGNAGFPPLLFLQVLFGRRSLAEVVATYDDAWANDDARALIEAIFPQRLAFVMPLD